MTGDVRAELPHRLVSRYNIDGEDLVGGQGVLATALRALADGLAAERQRLAEEIDRMGLADRVEIEMYLPELSVHDDWAADQRTIRASERIRYRLRTD